MESVARVQAVLFDRDGTLVEDVPYNGDPQLVRPVAQAKQALQRLRDAGLRLGIISNQSGVARGMITIEQVEAVNRRVEELLGPFDVTIYCPHGPDEDCACRKPLPGMIVEAARMLHVPPAACVVIGDKPSDVDAANAAGARAIFIDEAMTLVNACDDVLKTL